MIDFGDGQVALLFYISRMLFPMTTLFSYLDLLLRISAALFSPCTLYLIFTSPLVFG
jgi:hypothetical protein